MEVKSSKVQWKEEGDRLRMRKGGGGGGGGGGVSKRGRMKLEEDRWEEEEGPWEGIETKRCSKNYRNKFLKLISPE